MPRNAAMQPADELYDAKGKVPGEYVKHHVKEEEQPGGSSRKPSAATRISTP